MQLLTLCCLSFYIFNRRQCKSAYMDGKGITSMQCSNPLEQGSPGLADSNLLDPTSPSLRPQSQVDFVAQLLQVAGFSFNRNNIEYFTLDLVPSAICREHEVEHGAKIWQLPLRCLILLYCNQFQSPLNSQSPPRLIPK